MARVVKQDAERFLADVPAEQVFWCCDGRMLRNMTELEQALESMTDEDFAHHVSGERHDFSTWVRDVIRDEPLAKDLKKSLNRSQAAKKVAGRISHFVGKLAAKPVTKKVRTPAKKTTKKR